MASETAGRNEPTTAGKGSWLQRRLIPLFTVLVVVAIMLAIFLYRDRVAELGNYGYLGAFLICLLCNASIILPVPGLLLIFALGAAFNPFLVGLASSAGGTIGELTGYMLGYGGRRIVENRGLYTKAVQWLKKWGALTIFVFAVTPLPDDIAGITAGALRFPVWKFLLVCFLGKALLSMGIAWAGAWGWETILRFLS